MVAITWTRLVSETIKSAPKLMMESKQLIVSLVSNRGSVRPQDRSSSGNPTNTRNLCVVLKDSSTGKNKYKLDLQFRQQLVLLNQPFWRKSTECWIDKELWFRGIIDDSWRTHDDLSIYVLISMQKNLYLHQHCNFLKTRFINLTKYSATPQTDGDIR